MKQRLQIIAVFAIALFLIAVYEIKTSPETSETSSVGSPTAIPTDQVSDDADTASVSASPAPTVTTTPTDLTVINNYNIEFKAGSETIRIPLKDIPALYDALVDGYDLNNADDTSQIVFQLSRINPQVITTIGSRYYILINYNCGVKLSDYLLLSYGDGDIQTLHLNMGVYLDHKIADDKYLAAFLFCQEEGPDVYHDMTVVNLREMKIIPMELPAAYSYTVAAYDWKYNELFIDYQSKEEEELKTSINYPDSCVNGSTPFNIQVIVCNNDNSAADPYEIVYIDEKEGYKLVSLDYAMFQEPAELYKTEDGGKTWTMINSSDETLPGEAKSGLTFLNSKTGWIATGIPKAGYIGVYRTLDGGLTWRLQDFDIPEIYSEAEIYPTPPVFFSKRHGILIAEYHADKISGFLAFVTHNGGKSWSLKDEGLTDEDLSWTVDTTGNTSVWKVTYDEVTWESSNFRTFQISE